jgi:hypothetical protein
MKEMEKGQWEEVQETLFPGGLWQDFSTSL